MLETIRDILLPPAEPFSLEQIPNFPYKTYQSQMTLYGESERWYKGDALADQPQAQTGKQTDLYPMRVNPIKATVLKHAYAVFGEVENDGRPLVVTKMIPPESGSEEDSATWKEIVQHAEDVLNLLWWENNGRELMIRNAIMSQIYGGCIIKATYVPWEGEEFGGWRQIPIRLEAPNPKTFIGIPDASDYFRLAQCWIVRKIESAEAMDLGYSPKEGEDLWYIEWWSRDKYWVHVNYQQAYRMVGENRVPLAGDNPFGCVPAIYIPHIRDLDFLGSNAFDHLIAYVKELNLRYGDYGDAVNDDAHPIVATRDVSGTPTMRKLTSWLEYVDLGQTQSISGNEKPPDMFEVRQQRASASMKDLITTIWNQYERDSFVPPVAYGEDEGSQRSGMTLAMRFWPLGSHASTERYFWTAGLDVLQPMLLRLMKRHKLSGVTEKHTKLRMKQIWAPLLPRDREADVQEWVQRAAANLGSPEHLLELAGDVNDIPEERQRMLKWIEDLEDVKAKIASKYALKETEAQGEIDKDVAEIEAEALAKQAEQNAISQRENAAKPKPKPAAGGSK